MSSDEHLSQNVPEDSSNALTSSIPLKSLPKVGAIKSRPLLSQKVPTTSSLRLSKPLLNTQLTSLAKSSALRPNVISNSSLSGKVGSHISSSVDSLFSLGDDDDDETHMESNQPPLGNLETLIQSGLDSLPSTATSVPTTGQDDEDVSLADIPTYSRRGLMSIKPRVDTVSRNGFSRFSSSPVDDDDDELSKYMKTIQSEFEEQQKEVEEIQKSLEGATKAGSPAVSIPSPSADDMTDSQDTQTAPATSASSSLSSSGTSDSVVGGNEEEASSWAMFPSAFGSTAQKQNGVLSAATVPVATSTSKAMSAMVDANSNAMPSTAETRGSIPSPPDTTTTTSTMQGGTAGGIERFYGDEEELEEGDYAESDMLTWAQRQATVKKKDFSVLTLPPLSTLSSFEKSIYIEHPAVTALTNDQVQEIRKKDHVKIRGLDIPKPISSWSHCGLPSKLDEILMKDGCTAPFPIQAHTIPIILSGRDCIACAKTGSGKTLAFVLPMLRHISRQAPVREGEGPIAIILIPTRELAVQCAAVVKKLSRATGARVVAAYGGHNVAEQIALCKQGCEVLVGTPGRILDLLSLNKGKIINLHRVTFIVLDEADRMFDMGFEPQILMIVKNTRPDRQTVLFSATFPRTIENLAKQVLTRPLEVVIGGKSVASDTVNQIVEVIDEHKKFYRLLEILGNWYGKGNILIFVDRQDTAELLYTKLAECGYPSLALHGGMDQVDRDYTVADFKNKLRTILVATSLVSRGLDVKELNLVINYVAPSHMEDYVHRIGRTGRAGNLGTAITFITPQEEALSIDLVRALERSKVAVPPALQRLCDSFREKVKNKEAVYYSNSGYVTTGYRFTENEAKLGKKRQEEERALFAEREGVELAAMGLDHGDAEQERLEREKQKEERRERERREREEQERLDGGRKRERKHMDKAHEKPVDGATTQPAPTPAAITAAAVAPSSKEPSTASTRPSSASTSCVPAPAASLPSSVATTPIKTSAAPATTTAVPPASAPPSAPGSAAAAKSSAAPQSSGLMASVQAMRAAAHQARAAIAAATTPTPAEASRPPLPLTTLSSSGPRAPPPPPPSFTPTVGTPGSTTHATPTTPTPPVVPAPSSAQKLSFDLAAIKEKARLAAQASMQSSGLPVTHAAPVTTPAAPQAKPASSEALQRAMAAAARLGKKVGASSSSAVSGSGVEGVDYFRLNFDVNDYPQQARWLVLKKDVLSQIMEQCEVLLLVKGTYIPPGKQPQMGEERLYVSIEGRSDDSVRRARVELYRRLEEASRNVQVGAQGGKYNVV